MKWIAVFALIFPAISHSAELISFKLHFLEALAPKDTTSSERFQKEYEGTISSGKTLVAKKLAGCGYVIEDKTIFYNSTDSLEALEKGKASEKEGAWLLLGPRRSNHYILLTQGAPLTPSISSMASSDEVEKLGPLHLSISPSNNLMAKVAAAEAKVRIQKNLKTYLTIVSEDCVACLDFANQFDTAAKPLGLKRLQEIKIAGEAPELTAITKSVADSKPTVILAPNYSKVTAQIIAALTKVNPNILFVGGDGWGDSKFGFVQNANDLEKGKGITVRGFPPVENALKQLPIGKKMLNDPEQSNHLPGSASSLAVLKVIEGLADLLCEVKPKTKTEFSKAFEKYGKKFFRSPWGVSVYELKSGDITYLKSVRP